VSGLRVLGSTTGTGAYVPAVTNASTFGAIYEVLKINPSTVGIAPFEIVEHTVAFSGTDDQTAFIGWNAALAAGGGVAGQPLWALGLEYDYNNGSGKGMEFYLEYVSSDGTQQMRPIYAFVSRNTANAITAAVEIQLGTADDAAGTRQFVVSTGEEGTSGVLFQILPASNQSIFGTPAVTINGTAGTSASLDIHGDATAGGAGAKLLLDGAAGAAAFSQLVAGNGTQEYFRDEHNSRYHMIFTGGNSAANANTNISSTVTVGAFGTFAAGDKYVIADASGNLHLSATGPAS
jgi:hypothetical protein